MLTEALRLGTRPCQLVLGGLVRWLKEAGSQIQLEVQSVLATYWVTLNTLPYLSVLQFHYLYQVPCSW